MLASQDTNQRINKLYRVGKLGRLVMQQWTKIILNFFYFISFLADLIMELVLKNQKLN